jgi:hypothetical protein
MKTCSLQQSIDKWFSPTQRDQIRVTRFRRNILGGQTGVMVRLLGATDTIELLFFRHSDGTWCIFPAAERGPTMKASALVAS